MRISSFFLREPNSFGTDLTKHGSYLINMELSSEEPFFLEMSFPKTSQILSNNNSTMGSLLLLISFQNDPRQAPMLCKAIANT